MREIKILHVFGILDRGGAETFVMNMYRNIDREKYQFDFLVHGDQKGDYEKEIKQLGGNIYRIPKFKGFNYFSYKKSLKRFFKNNNDYEYVHSHIMSTAKTISKEAKKQKLKTISHSHETSTISRSIVQKIIRRILRVNISKYADIRLSCGKEAGDYFYNKNDYIIIENGIDFKKYLYKKENKNKVIGHVGSFGSVKNHTFIIEVFRELIKIDDEFKLILVGEGALRKDIEEKVREYDLTKKVKFTGSVNNVEDYLKKMDLFLMPSLHEGFPLVLVEAQASHIDILASSNIPNEIKMSNFVYFKSLEDNYESWARKIITIYEKDKEKLLEDKIYQYDVKKVVEKYLEILKI